MHDADHWIVPFSDTRLGISKEEVDALLAQDPVHAAAYANSSSQYLRDVRRQQEAGRSADAADGAARAPVACTRVNTVATPSGHGKLSQERMAQLQHQVVAEITAESRHGTSKPAPTAHRRCAADARDHYTSDDNRDRPVHGARGPSERMYTADRAGRLQRKIDTEFSERRRRRK